MNVPRGHRIAPRGPRRVAPALIAGLTLAVAWLSAGPAEAQGAPARTATPETHAAQDGAGAAADADADADAPSRETAARGDRAAPPESDPELIARLDHPDWAVREAATQRLRRSRTLDPEAVIRLVAEHELSLEARSRLLLACHDTFVTAPLGAIGIRHMRVDDGTGTVISEVIPGFDAARVLRAQDLLLTIDGVRLGGFESLARAVQRRRPGDVVEVELRRPQRDGNAIRRHPRTGDVVYGPPITVEVELGSFDMLPGGNWSNRPMASDVPIERRMAWREAVRAAGATPRVLALPDALTEPPAPREPRRRRIR